MAKARDRRRAPSEATSTGETVGRFFKSITSQRVDDNNIERIAQALAVADISEIHLLSMKRLEDGAPVDEESRKQFRTAARKVLLQLHDRCQGDHCLYR